MSRASMHHMPVIYIIGIMRSVRPRVRAWIARPAGLTAHPVPTPAPPSSTSVSSGITRRYEPSRCSLQDASGEAGLADGGHGREVFRIGSPTRLPSTTVHAITACGRPFAPHQDAGVAIDQPRMIALYGEWMQSCKVLKQLNRAFYRRAKIIRLPLWLARTGMVASQAATTSSGSPAI